MTLWGYQWEVYIVGGRISRSMVMWLLLMTQLKEGPGSSLIAYHYLREKKHSRSDKVFWISCNRICWTLKNRSGPGDCATEIEGEGTHETPTTTANAVDHFTVRLGWAFWHGIGQVRQCPELEDEKAYCYRCFAEPFRRASQHRCQSLVWYSSNPLHHSLACFLIYFLEISCDLGLLQWYSFLYICGNLYTYFFTFLQ